MDQQPPGEPRPEDSSAGSPQTPAQGDPAGGLPPPPPAPPAQQPHQAWPPPGGYQQPQYPGAPPGQPGYGQPGYGQPGSGPAGYGPPAYGYAAAAPPNDGMAIWSLVLGILSLFCCGIILGPVAFFLGQSSLGRIRQSAGHLGGAGLANAGRITGAIGVLLWIVVPLIYVGGFAATHSFGSSSP